LAQSKPILIKATSKSAKIKDGDKMSGWSLSPEIKPDVFVANRTRKTKNITFYTDIDSITFKVKPYQKYSFIVLLNNKDTCQTVVQSAIQNMTNRHALPTRFATDTIPFTLTAYNNISIKTIVNQVDTLDLMFHSGTNSVYITKEGLAKTTHLKLDKSGQVQSWGGSADAAYSTTNSLQVGNFKWDSLEITIDERSGQGTDGKFGFSLFDNKVLEVNYDLNQLIIHSKLPKSLKGYAKLPMEFANGSFFLETKIKLKEQGFQDKFMFHTGYAGNLILGTQFMEKHPFKGQLDTLGVVELKDSYSNIIKNITTNIASVQLGETIFSNIRGGLMDKKARFPTNVLGNDLLKRFNVFVDFQNDVIYLKPNKLLHSPYKNGV
jgi:Aspartyl protease